MNYEGLIACATILAIACFQLGRAFQRHMTKRDTDATERIRQKYQSHISSSRRFSPNSSTKN